MYVAQTYAFVQIYALESISYVECQDSVNVPCTGQKETVFSVEGIGLLR